MNERQFPCSQCGARLEYAPGTEQLQCPYCGSAQTIPSSDAVVEEVDFESAVASLAEGGDAAETLTIKCNACGAETVLQPNVTTDRCSFCGTSIVASALSKKAIKPHALLPFKVDLGQARTRFRNWVSGLWFAPNRLQSEATSGRIDGVYLPHWTFDCDTATRYDGQRGDDYTVTESYTAIENGQQVRGTREVTRTRWSRASGQVEDGFDDVLVAATRSLPAKYLERLEPWDLPGVVPYSDEFVSGFRVESYAVSLPEGFTAAKTIMAATIRQTICHDIGGDHQQVDSVETHYRGITFKHVLLPVWISSYRFNSKVYRFLVNARTGEVQGERPWSVAKILLAVLAALIALCGAGLVVALIKGMQH